MKMRCRVSSNKSACTQYVSSTTWSAPADTTTRHVTIRMCLSSLRIVNSPHTAMSTLMNGAVLKLCWKAGKFDMTGCLNCLAIKWKTTNFGSFQWGSEIQPVSACEFGVKYIQCVGSMQRIRKLYVLLTFLVIFLLLTTTVCSTSLFYLSLILQKLTGLSFNLPRLFLRTLDFFTSN